MGWQLVNGERKYVWDQFNSPTPSARRQALKDESEIEDFISRLATASPQQIRAYVQANTNDANEMRNLIIKLAVTLSYVLTASGSDRGLS